MAMAREQGRRTSDAPSPRVFVIKCVHLILIHQNMIISGALPEEANSALVGFLGPLGVATVPNGVPHDYVRRALRDGWMTIRSTPYFNRKLQSPLERRRYINGLTQKLAVVVAAVVIGVGEEPAAPSIARAVMLKYLQDTLFPYVER